jgi:chromate transporter
MLIWKIFVLYSRVALFSWGGGPASLALMQRETTEAMWLPPGATVAVPWATPLEFSDAVAVGNALPGPIAPQVSAYVGYKLAGVPGAVAAAAGTPHDASDVADGGVFFQDQGQPAGPVHVKGRQAGGGGALALDRL